MPIINQELWDQGVELNSEDEYGMDIIEATKNAMKILDNEDEFDIDDVMNRVGGQLSGFQAGIVSVGITECHSRGEEWRKAWNLREQIGNEGERYNREGGVINPAIMNIERK